MISVSEAVGQALLGYHNSLLLSVATFDYSSVIKVTFARMADEISDDAWDVLNGSGMGQGSESFSKFVRMTSVGDLGRPAISCTTIKTDDNAIRQSILSF
jgi:hypothetical protein